MITAPETITLRLLKPDETTAPGDRILCDGHFYPVSLHGEKASEFDVAIYRETDAQEIAA